MRRRWPEWALAMLLVGLTALLVLRPAAPRPGDLRLEVVSVRSLPLQEGTPQTVEVQVRWHWLHPPAAGSRSQGRHLLVLGADPGRWVLHGLSSFTQAEPRLLNLLGQPTSLWAVPVDPARDGSLGFTLAARAAGYSYRAPVIPLWVHYVHEAAGRFSAPHRTWVQTVSGVYPLEPAPRATDASDHPADTSVSVADQPHLAGDVGP